MATELEVALLKLNLQSYLSQFLSAGFYDWHSLSKITESDLVALKVIRGYRRKLRRAIARSGGWPDSHPLPPTIGHSQIRDGFAEGRAASLSSRSTYSSSNILAISFNLAWNELIDIYQKPVCSGCFHTEGT